ASIEQARGLASGRKGSSTPGQVRQVGTAQAKPPAADEPAAPRDAKEAQAMLRGARKLLADGKLDEVSDVITTARRYNGSYGLFDDSPDKQQKDLARARVKHDKEESGRVMKEARKQYQAGEYDEAARLAYKAQQLHGSYSIWDLGD